MSHTVIYSLSDTGERAEFDERKSYFLPFLTCVSHLEPKKGTLSGPHVPVPTFPLSTPRAILFLNTPKQMNNLLLFSRK